MNKILYILIIVLSISTIYFKIQSNKNSELYSVAQNNYKSTLDKNVSLKLSVTDLKYSKDSVIKKIDSLIKHNNINLKNVKYIVTTGKTITKYDTIRFSDSTIFSNKNKDIDTVVGDRWISNKIKITHPNIMKINTTVKDSIACIIHNEKEIIGTPSKFFFIRWFQKKQILVKIDVINFNPYSTNGTNKFIEIIK